MAGFDPFDGAETPVDEPAPAPKKTRTPRKKETPVSDETQANGITISVKGHSGFDAALFVAKFGTLDEADEFLAEENREKVKRVIDGMQALSGYTISKAPEGAKPRAGGGAKTGGGDRPGGTPQAATEHPRGKKEFCSHGDMIFKSGTYKTDTKYKKAGDTWYAFDCSEDICDRKWDNGR